MVNDPSDIIGDLSNVGPASTLVNGYKATLIILYKVRFYCSDEYRIKLLTDAKKYKIWSRLSSDW